MANVDTIHVITEVDKSSVEEALGSLGDAIKNGFAVISATASETAEVTTAALCDAAAEAYQGVSDTLEGKVEGIRNSARELGLSIYSGIEEPLKGLADAGLLYMGQLQTAFTEGGLEGLVAMGMQAAADIGLGLSQGLPQLFEAVNQLIGGLTAVVSENFPVMIAAGGQLLSGLISGLLPVGDSILTLGAQIIQGLISGILLNLPQIVSQGNEMIRMIGEAITVNLPVLIQSGIELIAALTEGIAQMLPVLLQMAVEVILAFILSLSDPNCLLQLINAGIGLLMGLAAGLNEAIPKLIEAAPVIIANLVRALIEAIPQLLNAASEIMMMIGKYMLQDIGKLLLAIPGIFSEMKRAFSEIDWSSIGRNLIGGVTTGVAAAASGLVDRAVQAAKDAVQAVKRWLGIESPSKLMRDMIGKNMIAGIGVGIDLESGNLERDAVHSVKNAVEAVQRIDAGRVIGAIRTEAYRTTVGSDRIDQLKNSGGQSDGQEEKPVFVLQKDSIKVEATVNGKKIAEAAAPYLDTELGMMQERKERG